MRSRIADGPLWPWATRSRHRPVETNDPAPTEGAQILRSPGTAAVATSATTPGPSRPPKRATDAQARTRRARLPAIVCAGCLLVLCLPPSPAAAHSVLVSSSPPESSVLATAPAAVRLEFDHPVLSEFARAGLTVGGRETASIAPVITGSVVTINLPVIEAVNAGGGSESWQLSYQLLSVGDGHPVGGTVTFTVGSGSTSPAANDVPNAGVLPPATLRAVWWITGAIVALLSVAAGVRWRRARRQSDGRNGIGHAQTTRVEASPASPGGYRGPRAPSSAG